LELRKERQGQRIKAAALNEKPNGPIRGSRLLQQNLPNSDIAALHSISTLARATSV
jgi:hypothetical protein